MENNRLCSCYRLSSLSAFGVRNQLPHWEGLCLDRDERDIERQTQTHTERSTGRERLCSDRRALYKALCSLFYNNDSEIMFVPRMKSWRSRFSRCSASVYAQRAFEERRRGRRECNLIWLVRLSRSVSSFDHFRRGLSAQTILCRSLFSQH